MEESDIELESDCGVAGCLWLEEAALIDGMCKHITF